MIEHRQITVHRYIALVANRIETHLNEANNKIPPNSDGPVFSTESDKRLMNTSSGRIRDFVRNSELFNSFDFIN